MFKYRTQEWNKFLRPDSFDFDYLVDPNGKKAYDYLDFRPLLLD